MKKFYFIAASLFVGVGAMAQTTITSHFEGALTNPQQPQVGAYTYNGGAGYVSGTNDFEDQAVVQLFDASYGIPAGAEGTINSVKVLINSYTNTTTSGKIKVGVWANDNGTPGAELQLVDVALSSIDTSAGGLEVITAGSTLKGIYNVSVNLTGVAIPANGSFFAGVLLPTTAATGDTAVVLTTVPPFVFANAATHAGTLGSDDEFYGYGVAAPNGLGLNISNAIFPTVTISTSGISDLENDNNLVVYPNPATDQLNFKVEGTEVSVINIFGTDGKLVTSAGINAASGSVNVSSLNAGMYIYEVIAANGASVKKTFVKK